MTVDKLVLGLKINGETVLVPGEEISVLWSH